MSFNPGDYIGQEDVAFWDTEPPYDSMPTGDTYEMSGASGPGEDEHMDAPDEYYPAEDGEWEMEHDVRSASGTSTARRTRSIAAVSTAHEDTLTPTSRHPGKMFIGGLNWETTDESLRNYFSEFGEVVECTVMRDNNTGRSRGFGFLTFKDAKTVNTVMVKEHFLDGKIIDPKRAIPRDEQEKTSKIFVGGVSQEATDQEFREYFQQFGRVVDATLMMDKDTGRPRGFGFVTFENEAGVEACINTPLEIHGKPIEVKKAQPRGNIREEEEAARRNKFRKDDQVGGGGQQGGVGGAQAIAGGMSPQVMAQYMQRMQQYFAAMQQQQQQMAMNRGMGGGMGPMNPMMQQMMMAQMQQQMMGRGAGSPGAQGGNPGMMGGMNPAMMQQMMAAQQQQQQQQGGMPSGGMGGGDMSPQGAGGMGQGQGGYDQQQQMYDQQPAQQQQQRRGRDNNNQYGQGQGHGQGQGQAHGYGGGPTSWEGMYDDVPQPNVPQGPGRGGFKQRGGSSAPANAPTGPRNAGRPGANYRGGGRGANRGFHPYSRG
ncbi:related to heterogeneous nuclear ribonucleoprotein HRP1 [Cephalotrichum gorgonifer]|uniref:Related to heterogeneous nuclear ribonucleoprotein HRP1 n=1 Tax=Cephalotrichum gorgonifer TaxID=2041049 RepID=A0AAE8N819_9PEZI|nr:related to heterogeneous nuclear ribonucleoprotein HRP1 [Cephalotrichum gorgonifer]